MFESLPENDPAQRRPDITRAKNLLGWEPAHLARGGPSAGPRAVGPARADRKDYLSMQRRYLAALVVAAISCAVLPAAASAKLKMGVTRSPCRIASPTLFCAERERSRHERHPVADQLGATSRRRSRTRPRIRTTRPTTGGRSTSSSRSRRRGRRPSRTRARVAIYDIWGTPKWARLYTGHVSPSCRCRRRRTSATSSGAVAKRYNGTFIPAGSPAGTKPLPRITHWEIWNEPNNALGLAKPSKSKGKKNGVPAGAKAYVTLLNTAYGAIHGQDQPGKSKAQVIGGSVGGRTGIDHITFYTAVLRAEGQDGRHLDPPVLDAAGPRPDGRRSPARASCSRSTGSATSSASPRS